MWILRDLEVSGDVSFFVWRKLHVCFRSRFFEKCVFMLPQLVATVSYQGHWDRGCVFVFDPWNQSDCGSHWHRISWQIWMQAEKHVQMDSLDGLACVWDPKRLWIVHSTLWIGLLKVWKVNTIRKTMRWWRWRSLRWGTFRRLKVEFWRRPNPLSTAGMVLWKVKNGTAKGVCCTALVRWLLSSSDESGTNYGDCTDHEALGIVFEPQFERRGGKEERVPSAAWRVCVVQRMRKQYALL